MSNETEEVEVSDKEIEASLRGAVVKSGIYLAQSLGATKSISKVGKGKGLSMAVETLQLLRPSDAAISAHTIKKWHLLPIISKAKDLAENGYAGYDAATEQVVPDSQIAKILQAFSPDGPNGLYLNDWRYRLRAGFGGEAYPRFPKAVEGSNFSQFTLADGTVVDKATAQKAKGELIRAVKQTAWSVFKDGSLLKGQRMWVEVWYPKNKETKEEMTDSLPNIEFRHLEDPPKDKEGNLKTPLDPFVSVR